MEQNRVPIDENATKLIKKCEDPEIATEGMGACQVLIEEMDKGDVVLEDEPGKSFMNISNKMKSQSMEKKDVPDVVRIAFFVRDTDVISDEKVKNAARRLIRVIEEI
jgi:hypothetical protein